MRNILFSLAIAPLFLLPASPVNIDRTALTQPAISIADTRIVEGNMGQTTVEVMVSLSQAAPAPVTVTYNMKNGTALDKSDYILSEGSVSFTRGDMVKWIKVLVIGEVVCEDDEKFEIMLSNPSGATLDDETGTVIIENDDCILSSLGIKDPSLLPVINDPSLIKKAKVYEVRLTHTGFASFVSGPDKCPIRADGIVTLTGLLYGVEDVATDDDIEYRGTLQLNMDMDLCSVNAENDEHKLCGMRLVGAGPVEVILKINFDQRGGYIQFEHKSGSFLRSITGNCDRDQMDEEKTMIPNRTMASIFNGRDLPMLTNRTLSVGRYVEDDGEGNVTVVEVLREIKIK